jgi:hypothetical protein
MHFCPCGSERKYKKCCLDPDRERARGDRPEFTIEANEKLVVNNGHIVPRMFQKAWEGEGRKVAVHADHAGDCRLESTKKVATRGAFYRRTRPQGEHSDDTEESLQVIENKATRSRGYKLSTLEALNLYP